MDLEAIDLLRSIDGTLKQLLKLSQSRQAAKPKLVASDRDLDGKHGDPEVHFNPRDWTGPSFKKRRMSECPPDFLELLAQSLDYFGDKAEQADERANNGKPVADYKRLDAARARGWALRNKGRRFDPAPEPPAFAEAAAGGDDWAARGTDDWP